MTKIISKMSETPRSNAEKRGAVIHESRVASHEPRLSGDEPRTTNCESRGESFAARIIRWQRQHGRHDLPWQSTRDPYRIWVSEIMLQQTQVSAVIPYYQRFMARFPDVSTLAAADEDEVLAHWSGLGYYARGRNLHRAARLIVERHADAFPSDFEAVCTLPGVGRSTAAAICVFAFGQHRAILDGNVRRVLARHAGIHGYPGDKRVEDELWQQAESLLPERDIESYTQGLMDLGAGPCSRRGPDCGACPVGESCVARHDGLTRDLPSPRPTRTLPQRETAMLILMSGGEVLLEKRPASGIWGGLWSFPETDENQIEDAAVRYGVRPGRLSRLTVLEHGFTHFKLRIRPVLAHVARRSGLQEPGLIWLTVEDALGAAIPSPVKRILGELRAAHRVTERPVATAEKP
jgi:A/G-specific adenine glycosylase